MNLQLAALRESNHLTQTELAAKVGATLRKVSAWERGETPIRLEDAAMIADVFGCTLDELAGREWSPSEYSDPRQAELNKCWDECEEGDRTAILRVAKSFAAQEKSDGAPPGRGDPVPAQPIA